MGEGRTETSASDSPNIPRSLLHTTITDYWLMWVPCYPSSNPSSVLSIDLAELSLTCWFSSFSLLSFFPLYSTLLDPSSASLPPLHQSHKSLLTPWISPDFTSFLSPLPSQTLSSLPSSIKDGCRSITNLGGYGKDYKLYASFLLRKGLVFFRWRRFLAQL